MMIDDEATPPDATYKLVVDGEVVGMTSSELIFTLRRDRVRLADIDPVERMSGGGDGGVMGRSDV